MFYPLNYGPYNKIVKPYLFKLYSSPVLMKKEVAAFAALTGTIIGAAFLGIPYTALEAGLIPTIIEIIFIGLIILIAMLYLGEIILRTPKNHELAGYAELYLGKKGKYAMLFTIFFGIYSALLAYLVGEGESLSHLFTASSSYSLLFGLAFGLGIAACTYTGIKFLKKGELGGIALVFLLFLIIIIVFAPKITLANIPPTNLSKLHIPFGVILFSFLAFSVLPVIKEILGKKTQHLKKIIISSYLTAIALYILFTIIVIGVFGNATPKIATIALGKIFIILGCITMFNACLGLSIALTEIFHLDLNIQKKTAWILTTIPPLIVFAFLSLIHKTDFIQILSIGGSITGTLLIALVIAMHKKAKEKGTIKPSFSIPHSNYVSWTIICICILATALQIYSFS